MGASVWIWSVKKIFEETWNEISAQRSAPETVPVSMSTREGHLLNSTPYVFK